MKLGDLFIKLGLRSEEFNTGIDKAKGGLSGLIGVAKSMAGALTGAFTVRKMFTFFSSAVKLASEQIAVENKLGAAIRANGQDIDTNLKKYKDFASSMQRMTTIGDETTLSLIQLAVTMQSDAPEEAARMAIGLSKALGMDLQTATRAAVLAQNGNTIALSRYIPGVRSATTEAEKLAAVQKVVASGLQIAMAETEKAPGKLEQLKNAWGDLKEVIGSGIVNSKSIKQDLDDWTTLITIWQSDQLSGWQKFYSSISKKAMNSNAEILKSYQELGPNIEAATQIQQGYNVAMGETDADRKRAASLAEIGRIIREKAEAENAASSAAVVHAQTVRELEAEIKALKESMLDFGIDQQADIAATAAQIKAKEELLKSLTSIQGPYDQLADKISKLKKQQQDLAIQNKDISGITAQIDALEKQKKAADFLIERTNQQAKEFEGLQASIDASYESLSKFYALINSQGNVTENFLKSTKVIVDTKGITGETSQMLGKFQFEQEMPEILPMDTEMYMMKLENFRRFKEDFQMLVADFGIDVVEQFGSALGELMATGEISGDFGKNILSSIGKFISTLGKMLIGLGMASEAFQKMISSGFLGGGIGLIVAGAALVALGGAISSYVKSRGSVSGQTGGGSDQPSGGFGVFGTSQRGSFELAPISTSIRGNELTLLIGREERRNSTIS